MEQPERQKSAKKALDNARHESQMREALAAAVRSFLAGLPKEPPEVPASLKARLIHLADFVTRCRSGVVRDRYRRELEYAPEPEMPARFVKQIFELLRGVALVLGHHEATAEDMDRVALDSIPAVRRVVLRAVDTMTDVDNCLKTSQGSQAVQCASATVRRALEDLQALGVLQVIKGGQGKADSWRPRGEWRSALDTLKTVESALAARVQPTFSANSAGASHTNFHSVNRSLPKLRWPAMAGNSWWRCRVQGLCWAGSLT
jgi:hypothetical protein